MTSRRASRRRSKESTATERSRPASSSFLFMIQWIFLGNLRSAIVVGVNIPFALFFSIIVLVLRGEDANLLSVGAVDFGIIVDSAVILVFRNCQGGPENRRHLLEQHADGRFGTDPT